MYQAELAVQPLPRSLFAVDAVFRQRLMQSRDDHFSLARSASVTRSTSPLYSVRTPR